MILNKNIFTSGLVLLLSSSSNNQVSAADTTTQQRLNIPEHVRQRIDEEIQKRVNKIPHPAKEAPPLFMQEDAGTPKQQQQPRIQPKDPRLEQLNEVPALGGSSDKTATASSSSSSSQSKKKETPPKRKRVGKCEDTHLNKMECKEWAWFGECEKNPQFMHDGCKKSCNMCETPTSTTTASSNNELALYDDDDDDCQDWFATCTEWSEKGNGNNVDNMCHGHWRSNKGTWVMTGAYVVEFCPKACNTCDIHLDDRDITLGVGVPQSFPGMEEDKELKNFIKGKVAETRAYIHSIENEKIKAVCKMSHPNCARFALSSDCQDQKDHPIMKYGCAAACQTCEDLLHDNGIFEAEHMWTNALQDWNDAKAKKNKNTTVKKTIGVAVV